MKNLFEQLHSIESKQRTHSNYWNALVNAATQHNEDTGIDIDPVDITLAYLTQ